MSRRLRFNKTRLSAVEHVPQGTETEPYEPQQSLKARKPESTDATCGAPGWTIMRHIHQGLSRIS